MRPSSTEQFFLWAVKIGLWIIPFLPLYVSTSMLFPFITGKNFAFRIIVEIIFALWLGLMVGWPQYRPRLTWIVKFATILIAVIFLADLFSPNPHRAFFSNYERMEGFMMLFHLYLYFLMLVSVFRTKKDWLIFFHITLAASLMVAFIGLLQRFGLYRASFQGGFRVDATIGNPTYLAAYLMFHVWLILYLIREFWRRWWLAGMYAVFLLFELLIIYFTATRGAAIALALAAPLFLLGVVWFWPRIFPVLPRGRKWVGAAFALVILLPLVLWLVRNTDFVRSSNTLTRLTNYSLEERTIQSRFRIWKMSFQGALDRPLLGWGQENYYLVFQKYYDPGLFSSEPWFDRSHNIVFDWLVHTGVAGFAAFFLLLGSAVWLLIRSVGRGLLDPWVGMAFMAAFFTYLIQNLFVFDNLNTYLLLFAFLAFSDRITSSEERVAAPTRRAISPGTGGIVAVGALLVVVILGYFFHIRAIREAQRLIKALQLVHAGAPANAFMGEFQRTLSYKTFGDTEAREQLAGIARRAAVESRFTREEQASIVAFSAQELQKEIDHPAKDIKHLLFLASILSSGAHLDPSYAREAESLIREAIRISPTKQVLYFELAQVLMRMGRGEEAVEVLERSVELDPRFMVARANFMTVAAAAGKMDVVNRWSEGLKISELDRGTLERIGAVYRTLNDFEKAVSVYELLIQMVPGEAGYHATLSALLGELGEIERAIRAAKRAAELDPSFAAEAKAFIELLKQGR